MLECATLNGSHQCWKARMPVALQRKKRKRMYPHHSACPPSLPSLIIETISLGLKSRLFHLFLFPPTVCPTTKALKMERKKEATYVSVPHPASPAL